MAFVFNRSHFHYHVLVLNRLAAQQGPLDQLEGRIKIILTKKFFRIASFNTSYRIRTAPNHPVHQQDQLEGKIFFRNNLLEFFLILIQLSCILMLALNHPVHQQGPLEGRIKII